MPTAFAPKVFQTVQIDTRPAPPFLPARAPVPVVRLITVLAFERTIVRYVLDAYTISCLAVFSREELCFVIGGSFTLAKLGASEPIVFALHAKPVHEILVVHLNVWFSAQNMPAKCSHVRHTASEIF